MKRVITIHRESKYDYQEELERAMNQVIDSLPDYVNGEIVVTIEVHKDED